MSKSFQYYLFDFLIILSIVGCSSSGKSQSERNEGGILGIDWDQASLKQLCLPRETENANSYSYPRMVELKNGDLLCVFEHNGNIEIIKSPDKGLNWSTAIIVTSARDKINVANPGVLETENGEIITAYNLRPRPKKDGTYDHDKQFSICVRRSADKGRSWDNEQVLYKAGADFKNGCWEPAMLQLPSGEIQLFFANEKIYTNTDEHNISMLKSLDNGLTWTKEPQIVSFARGFRDGMPVPIYDKFKNAVLLAIEDNSAGSEFNPSVIKLQQTQQPTFINASSTYRIRLLQNEISKDVYAGAPYIRQLNNGVVVLSVQSTLNRKKDWRLSTMDVAVGQNLNTLKLTNRPFNIPSEKSALWNSLCITKDNSIIALTSTNAFNDYTAIWMIRGKLKINK